MYRLYLQIYDTITNILRTRRKRLEALPVILLILIWGLIELLYFMDHQRALTPDEATRLKDKRVNRLRSSGHRRYSFPHYIMQPDKGFKSSMKASGQFSTVDMPMSKFPSYAAALLKGKKHEWIIVAFADGNTVKSMWFNKGNSRSVPLLLGYPSVVDHAKYDGCNIVLQFHNHPNPNPRVYNTLVPSKKDYEQAREMSAELNPAGLTLIDFVCSRGQFRQYYMSYGIVEIPEEKIAEIAEQIEEANGKTGIGNYKLHRQLGFFSGWTFKFRKFKRAKTVPIAQTAVLVEENEEESEPEPVIRPVEKATESPTGQGTSSSPRINMKALTNIVNGVDSLTGVQFEKLCMLILSSLGFENLSMTPPTGDHGVDLLGWKFKKKYAFQCKRYDGNVGNKAIQEVFTGKKLYAASEAIVITNSHFTKQAQDEASELGVILWDREKFLEKAYQAMEIISQGR